MAITARISSAPPAAPAAALPVTLSEGDVIEAKVAAILPNGQVRLATSLGTTDVATTVPLDVGATVRLLVQAIGQQLTLALMEAVSSGAQGATTGQGTQTASDGQLTAAQRGLLAAIQTALPSQSSPAALLANLKVLFAAPGAPLPAAVSEAARGVLGHALKADQPVSPDQVKAAVVGSGIFRETRLAAGDTGAASASGDLKSALLALRQSLAAVVAAMPPDKVGPAALPGAQDAVGASRAQNSLAGVPQGVLEALNRLPAAAREAAISALQSATGADPADMAALLARTGEPPASVETDATPVSPRAAPTVPDQVSSRPASASMPRVDLPPSTEDPAVASLKPNAGRGEIARTLLEQTDASLDRLRIAQYGALHRDDPAFAMVQSRDAPAWVFDIPVLTPQGASNAQVRISKDGRNGGDEASGRRWSVEFALDTTATGPVHAQIRLYGRHVGVTLWAERGETARLLQEQSGTLHDALGQAELQVEDVSVIAGAPGTPSAAERGYFVDTRS
jgi:hypothetical protein